MPHPRRGARTRRSIIMLVSLCLALVASLAPWGVADAAPSGRSQQWGPSEEAAFVAKINDLRSSQGLAPLSIDGELTEQSRRWAEQMRQRGGISHAPDLSVGVTADWGLIGENVGVGGDVESLFQAFVDSPGHYKNLVDPTYRFVGVGVAWDGNRMFTTHRFMALRSPAPAAAPAPRERPRPVESPTSSRPASGQPAASPPPEPPAPPTTTAPPPPPPQPPAAEVQRLALVTESLGDFFAD
ncbi:MAG: CAP domain-containing protein [Actinobacteria bacterium]|nr:CAP domain-containing protein [Actinomycetota bacterium]